MGYKKEEEFTYDELVEEIYPQLTEPEKNCMDEIINFHTESEFLTLYRRVALNSCTKAEFDDELFWEELQMESCETLLQKLKNFMDDFVRLAFDVDSDDPVARFFVLVIGDTNFLEEHYEEIELDDTLICVLRRKLSPMQCTYLLDYLEKASLEPYSDGEKILFLNDAIRNSKKYVEIIKKELLY